jgi:hypothetical protein
MLINHCLHLAVFILLSSSCCLHLAVFILLSSSCCLHLAVLIVVLPVVVVVGVYFLLEVLDSDIFWVK